jgi:chromosomal replication initiation ATPase DnaA
VSNNLWDRVLTHLRSELDAEDFRRWFGATAYAGDSGDQLTVWIPSAAIGYHINSNYQTLLNRTLTSLGRPYTEIRFVVGGTDEDEDDVA